MVSLCTGKDATKTLTEEGFGVSGFWFQRLVSGLNATTFVMKPLRSRWHRIIYLGDMMYTRQCCHIDRVYVIAWVSNYHSYNSNVHASMHWCIDARHACRMDWFPCPFNIFCQLYPDSIYSSFFFSGHPKETLQQRPITDFMFQHFADDLSFAPGDIGEIVRIAEGKSRFRVQWPKGPRHTLPVSAVSLCLLHGTFGFHFHCSFKGTFCWVSFHYHFIGFLLSILLQSCASKESYEIILNTSCKNQILWSLGSSKEMFDF